MSINIIIKEDISITNLINIHLNGGVVLKTPHVGNVYPNNLAMALLGIPILFYDRTLGRKDLGFHPHKIIIDGKSEVIANPNKLTTHSTVTNSLKKGNIYVSIGTKLTNLHVSYFLQAIPEAHCFTYTEYIKNNKKKVIEVLEVITRLHPNLWTRTVDKNGVTALATANTWEDILRIGIYGVTNSESGWIIPNPISIIFHCAIDTHKANTHDLYLLSGPDMFRYVESYKEKLDEIYKQLRTCLTWHLPEVLNCYIVPVLNMRFMVENKDKKALDNLINLYLSLVSTESLLRDIIPNKNYNYRFLIDKKNKLRQQIMNCISSNLNSFSKTVFYNTTTDYCFSQYDLLQSDGLYIHKWALDSKLRDVSEAFLFLKRFYSVAKKSKAF